MNIGPEVFIWIRTLRKKKVFTNEILFAIKMSIPEKFIFSNIPTKTFFLSSHYLLSETHGFSLKLCMLILNLYLASTSFQVSNPKFPTVSYRSPSRGPVAALNSSSWQKINSTCKGETEQFNEGILHEVINRIKRNKQKVEKHQQEDLSLQLHKRFPVEL